MKVIPAIDLRGGRCVRLFQGDYDRETEYSSEPAAVAGEFARLGVDRLHLVDLDGARDGEPLNRDIVRRIVGESSLAVQLGGGIRNLRAVGDWLDSGVDRCVIGSLAVTEPDVVRQMFAEFGADRIVLALDVRLDAERTPMLATHGWRETSAVTLWESVEGFLPAGLKHVLCTDVSRDGAMAGPNLELYRQIAARHPSVALQASGGVRNRDDLLALSGTGAAAAITGRALLDGSLTKEDLRTFLLGE